MKQILKKIRNWFNFYTEQDIMEIASINYKQGYNNKQKELEEVKDYQLN